MKLPGKAFWWRLAASGVSAALMWGAFAGRGEGATVFFALAPMLLLSRLSPRRTSAKWWFLFGFAFWFATLSWMPAIVKNGGPWPLVVLGWGALAVYCAAFYAAYGWFVAWARELWGEGRGARLLLLSVVEPLAWAALEWLRGNLFGGFAWNFLGVAAAEVRLCALPASVGGVYLVSFLALLANGVVATFVEHSIGPMLGREDESAGFRARAWRMLETGLPLVLILLGLFAGQFGAIRLAKAKIPMKVALVQRNFPCVFSADRNEDPLEVYQRLLATAALLQPDLTVFSESAMCEFGGVNTPRGDRGVALVRENASLPGYMLLGGDYREGAGAERKVYNAAALYAPEGGTPQVYCKQHLVPFGEFIPLDKVFPVLQKLAPIGSITPGKPQLLAMKLKRGAAADASPAGTNSVVELQLAPLICYEDTDPSLTRVAARQGANLFAFITNDSWFSNSAETQQHFQQSVLRCVETGLPAVRTGNSGVTGIIYPSGCYEVLRDQSEQVLVDSAGVMTSTLELGACNPRRPLTSSTPYTRWGDRPLVGLAALLAAACLLRFIRSKSRTPAVEPTAKVED